MTPSGSLKTIFSPVAAALAAGEKTIVAEMIAVQGKPADIGGYYQPDDKLASTALRPSSTLNTILAQLWATMDHVSRRPGEG